MGRHTNNRTPITPDQKAGEPVQGRHVRHPFSLPVFAFFAAVAFFAVSFVNPNPPALAEPEYDTLSAAEIAGQQVTVAGEYDNSVARDEYTTSTIAPPEPEPEPAPAEETVNALYGVAPVVGTPDPGTAQAIARDMLAARGYGDDQYQCLYALWMKESGWNVYAQNPTSGAYGIPQSLPGNKMATAGADWQTNPATQITWGLGYIEGRYGTPCGAWGHSQANNWY